MASAAAADHASAFAEIKQLITTEFPHRAFDEAECMRVLAARKFDVAAAAAQYRKTLAWKDEFQIDTIVERPPPEMREFIIHNCPISHHKWAKSGAPVFIEQMGKTNIPAMHKHGVTDNHVYLCHAWDMETVRRRCAEASARHGRHIEQNLNIIDVGGLNFSHVKGLHFMKAVVDIDLAHYPGTLERMCIINTPAVFPIIWNIAKGWLDPVTVSKVRMQQAGKLFAHLFDSI